MRERKKAAGAAVTRVRVLPAGRFHLAAENDRRLASSISTSAQPTGWPAATGRCTRTLFANPRGSPWSAATLRRMTRP